jgi:hypothetical protein
MHMQKLIGVSIIYCTCFHLNSFQVSVFNCTSFILKFIILFSSTDEENLGGAWPEV